MIKMLVLDIDGTILNKEFKYSEKLKNCLGDLRNKGVKVVIATGRMYSSTLKLARELDFGTPLVCYQGGVVRNFCDNDEILYQAAVPREKALEVIEYLRNENIHTNLYINDELFVECEDDIIKEYVKHRFVKYNVVKSFEDIEFDFADKILAIENDPKKFEKINIELQKKYRDELYVIKSMNNFLEVCNLKATKGNAIKFLCEYWGINIEETMAIGDQDNDIEMIETAGVGVAMGNATENMKKVADFVTKTVDEDGVCYAVEKFIGV